MRCAHLYRRTIFPSLFLLPIVVVLFLMASHGFSADDEALGRAAEQAGKLREALPHYVAALQSAPEGSSTEQQLRETIIKLVRKLDPPPAVPEEAERRMARGRAAVEAVTDVKGYLRASQEFYEATKAAPWLAEAYYNLGVVNEKASRYPEAVQSLKRYLLAAPNAQDAKQVRNLIHEIEYRQEEAQRARWCQFKKDRPQCNDEIGVTVSTLAGEVTIHARRGNGPVSEYVGTLSGSELTGEERGRNSAGDLVVKAPFKGTISSDSKTITLRIDLTRRRSVRTGQNIECTDCPAEVTLVFKRTD